MTFPNKKFLLRLIILRRDLFTFALNVNRRVQYYTELNLLIINLFPKNSGIN